MVKKNIDHWEGIVKNAPRPYLELFRFEKQFLTRNIKKDSRILEVGCGDGRSLKDIISITKNIIAIDHDKKAVKDAKHNLKGIPQIRILEADGEKLPFENEYFDYVLCLGTFSNLAEHKIRVLKEMKRVTKKGGAILIMCYNENALPARLQTYKEFNIPVKDIKDGTVIFDESVGDDISEQFTRGELQENFLKAGLNVDNIEKKGIGYFCRLSI